MPEELPEELARLAADSDLTDEIKAIDWEKKLRPGIALQPPPTPRDRIALAA